MPNNIITIPRNQFTKLLGALKLIENSCLDCDIVGGVIRQKTDDRQALVELDLSSILGPNDLIFSMLKKKIMLLKTFELTDNVKVTDENISIEITDTSYIFIDPLSKMYFKKSLKKFLDNTYIIDEEFSRVIKCQEENLLFTTTVTAYMSKRIKTICEGFENQSVRCDVNGLSANLSVSTLNNEDISKVAENIPLNKQMPKGSFKMMYMPFALDMNADITLKVYTVASDVLLCRFTQNFYGIPVVIYTQVRLVS